ncbi:hypothetical protein [Paraburkholderia sp. J76]|uniref:hypothetical protein n=1 Tax=Paraburkholderia sp. J76 TaxID=2805439 RepID=UPI002ABDFABF|nr:hypothetical protein [Paraburkholderia sp. J76]
MAGLSSGSARDLPVAGQGQDSTRIGPRVGRHVPLSDGQDYSAANAENRSAILIMHVSQAKKRGPKAAQNR